jgi:sulfur transfer protein SufE
MVGNHKTFASLFKLCRNYEKKVETLIQYSKQLHPYQIKEQLATSQLNH